MNDEQLSLLPDMPNVEEEAARVKRNWEDAFQRWSNRQMQDGTTAYGCCGEGYMCDWCTDNDYGRPCVRALNTMLREKRWKIDYSKRNFETVWNRGRL